MITNITCVYTVYFLRDGGYNKNTKSCCVRHDYTLFRTDTDSYGILTLQCGWNALLRDFKHTVAETHLREQGSETMKSDGIGGFFVIYVGMRGESFDGTVENVI